MSANTVARDQSFLPVVLEMLQASGLSGSSTTSTEDEQIWIHVRGTQPIPRQGWKLHVSAGLPSAEQVLRAGLPVLLEHGATFKVAQSLDVLRGLNDGLHGPSQVGKFITVYPVDDAQAVSLAVEIHEATTGLSGPAIPSDRPLRWGSLVHYRYGSFADVPMRMADGTLSSALETPDGDVVPDERTTVYKPPDWVVDPFLTAGAASPLPERPGAVGGRFVATALLSWSPRGIVQTALDTATFRPCILKWAWRDGQLGLDGRDARDRLRNERDLLARLAGSRSFPGVIDLVEHGDDLVLIMEDVGSETLYRHVMSRAIAGKLPAIGEIVGRGRQVAAMLEEIHDSGYVYRDLKSTNVIVADDGSLKLIDFDIALPLGATSNFLASRGYMSPQQAAGEPATVAEDVYAFGALLYFLATAAEPSMAPHPGNVLERPIGLLNPGVGEDLATLIARCLRRKPPERFATVREAGAALARIKPRTSVGARLTRRESEPEARARARDVARRLGNALCEEPLELPSRDLYDGTAGVVLALAELVAVLGDDRHGVSLRERALALTSSVPPRGTLVGGLYSGEGGVGAALLRAGQVLQNPGLIEAAAGIGRVVARLPHDSPDLIVGPAGRLRLHLALFRETRDEEHLRHARTAADALLRHARVSDDGSTEWLMPKSEGREGRQAYLGYAHGTAGMADALLDLHGQTGDPKPLLAAQAACRHLVRLAVPTLPDGSALDWPLTEGGLLSAAPWCYGAAGIGRLFLHAARLAIVPGAAEIAARAAKMTSRGTRWTGPVQCHGLAGSIGFLLDVYADTGDGAYLEEARTLSLLLDAFLEGRDGKLVATGDRPDRYDPSYMTGYAGIALCYLRLSDPENNAVGANVLTP